MTTQVRLIAQKQAEALEEQVSEKSESARFTEGQQDIIDAIPMRRTPTDLQRQFIAGNGDCSVCGGTHYGSQNCPYRCAICGVNTDPCERTDCGRK